MCEICGQNGATVFIARVLNGKASQQRLCETCARAQNDGHLPFLNDNFELNLDALQKVFGAEFPSDEDDADDLAEFMEAAEMEEDEIGIPISDEAFASMMSEAGIDIGTSGADFEANFQASLEPDSDEAKAFEQLFHASDMPFDKQIPEEASLGKTPARAAGREINAERCAKCGTTWDRLREDGRAGCAQCYVAFHEKLVEVMSRLQREAQHVGKTPRTALKRRRRLEHLRTRRDHRLEMLQRRLEEAVTAENYEDAAKIRDKIRIVTSTIVSDES
jgi:protein-arginine kinase activator protein McsA